MKRQQQQQSGYSTNHRNSMNDNNNMRSSSSSSSSNLSGVANQYGRSQEQQQQQGYFDENSSGNSQHVPLHYKMTRNNSWDMLAGILTESPAHFQVSGKREIEMLMPSKMLDQALANFASQCFQGLDVSEEQMQQTKAQCWTGIYQAILNGRGEDRPEIHVNRKRKGIQIDWANPRKCGRIVIGDDVIGKEDSKPRSVEKKIREAFKGVSPPYNSFVGSSADTGDKKTRKRVFLDTSRLFGPKTPTNNQNIIPNQQNIQPNQSQMLLPPPAAIFYTPEELFLQNDDQHYKPV